MVIGYIFIIDSGGTKDYSYEIEAFKRHGKRVLIGSDKDREKFLNIAKDAEIMLFTSTRFDRATLERLPNLKLLARYGIGLDTVDIDAASELGVFVSNTPSYGCFDVAQHAFSLLLTLNQNIHRFDNNVRSQNWSTKGIPSASRLKGKVLGLFGFGRISRYIAGMAKGFGMDVIATDPFVKYEEFKELKVKNVDFHSLLEKSDYLSLNAPLTADTRHVINRDAFKRMKPNVKLINTSRGELVDTDALIYALEDGLIAGAGLDVFEDEPLKDDSKLVELENVVLTPHIAWYSTEAMEDLKKEIIGNVISYIETGVPNNAVNEGDITDHY